MQAFIKRNRLALERDIADSPRKKYFSPAAYSQYVVTLPLIRQYSRGELIDLGCGDMPFKQFVIGQVDRYDSLDYFPRSAAVTYVGDIQDMGVIAANSYDTAICIEVLEHVPDPFRAAAEIARILKPNGVLILSVPHLSRLHDEPHDYYRYTKYGLQRLLQQAGLEVVAVEKRGGLFSFIGHQISTIVLAMVWRIPVFKTIVWEVNGWLITRLCAWLDVHMDQSGLFALGYTAVARKMLI